GVDGGDVSLDDHLRVRMRQLHYNPIQLVVAHQQVRAATQKFKRDAVGLKQFHHLGNGLMAREAKKIGSATDAQVGDVRERSAAFQFDAKIAQSPEYFLVFNTDVACADSEDGVAGSGFRQQALDAGLHGGVVKNLFVAGFANSVAQRFAGNALDGCFAGGVNIGEHQNVG